MTVLTARKPPTAQAEPMDEAKPSDARGLASGQAFEPRQAVEFFKLLADETRLRILLLLHQENELNVQSLCRMLKQTQPAVSHHLALLRGASLVELRREGKHNYYHLLPQRFTELLDLLRGFLPGDPSRESSWEGQ